VGFLENSRNLMTFCRNLSNLTHLFPWFSVEESGRGYRAGRKGIRWIAANNTPITANITNHHPIIRENSCKTCKSVSPQWKPSKNVPESNIWWQKFWGNILSGKYSVGVRWGLGRARGGGELRVFGVREFCMKCCKSPEKCLCTQMYVLYIFLICDMVIAPKCSLNAFCSILFIQTAIPLNSGVAQRFPSVPN
jgi:hypothetical protein